MNAEQIQNLIDYAIREKASANTHDAEQYWAGYIQALRDVKELL